MARVPRLRPSELLQHRDRPDAPAVTEAIHHYDEASRDFSAAIDAASEFAQNCRLNATKKHDLLAKAGVLDQRFTQLTPGVHSFLHWPGRRPDEPLGN